MKKLIGSKRSLKAFTLIEILVVIAVIGILAAMTTMGVRGVTAKARDTERKSDLNTIKNDILSSYSDHIDGVKTAESYAVATEAVPVSTLTWLVSSNYAKTLPDDPQKLNHYMYRATATDFAVYAVLESSSDSDIPSGNPTAGAKPDGYNYWVQND